MLNKFFSPIHKEGWPFIAIFAAVTFILLLISNTLGILGAVFTVWCIYFFRDPERFTPVDDNLVISPADGIVTAISDVAPPEELEMSEAPLTRVSIFLNVFDVHVNRSPLSGKILKIWYFPGKFVNASLDKASEFNERQAIRLQVKGGREIAFVQIAGLIARRIVCDVQEGDELLAGQRYGMIRFGSRVDVYLPKGAAPLVSKGQRMIAGETVLADLSYTGEPRGSEIR